MRPEHRATQTQTAQQVGEERIPRPGDSELHTLVNLFKELRDESTTLFRQEVALARVEITQKIRRILRNSAAIAAGAVVGLISLLFLLVAATFGIHVGLLAAGLSPGIANWLAPLIMGLVLGVIGGGLALKGYLTLRRESAVPAETVQSLQEDKEWLAHRLK